MEEVLKLIIDGNKKNKHSAENLPEQTTMERKNMFAKFKLEIFKQYFEPKVTRIFEDDRVVKNSEENKYAQFIKTGRDEINSGLVSELFWKTDKLNFVYINKNFKSVIGFTKDFAAVMLKEDLAEQLLRRLFFGYQGSYYTAKNRILANEHLISTVC